MKYGLINYNFPNYSLEQVLDFAHRTGFGYIQLDMSDLWLPEPGSAPWASAYGSTGAPPPGKLQLGYGYARFAPDSDDPADVINAVRELLTKYEMKLSALSAGNDFLMLDDASMRAQIERMERVGQVALQLGVNVLKAEGGFPKEGIAPARSEALIVEGLRGCVPFAERLGLQIALDNHITVTNDARLQVRIFEQVNSPNIGANLDTMNYRWIGYDLATVNQFYDIIAPYVKHTHMKDGRGRAFEVLPNGELKPIGQMWRGDYAGTALGEGELDLLHAIRALKRVGYDGVWCVEFEGPTADAEEGYRKGLEFLQAHVPAVE